MKQVVLSLWSLHSHWQVSLNQQGGVSPGCKGLANTCHSSHAELLLSEDKNNAAAQRSSVLSVLYSSHFTDRSNVFRIHVQLCVHYSRSISLPPFPFWLAVTALDKCG